jgi:hypothetical protein
VTTEELIGEYLKMLQSPELSDEKFEQALARIEKLKALGLK